MWGGVTWYRLIYSKVWRGICAFYPREWNNFELCDLGTQLELKVTTYVSLSKYCANDSALLKHCIAAFIKHVLPKFFNPHTPAILV